MIFFQLTQQLQALQQLLVVLSNQQYAQKVNHLGKASIGGHTRHVIELLQCAIQGYSNGKVDYVNRKRNLALENDRLLAIDELQALQTQMVLPDKLLTMVVDEIDNTASPTVSTTYLREMVYNTEHAIHHLALIKVALIEMQLEVVDDNFGMAYSTIKYKATQTN
ncbi:MAG: DinB family protein [Flavobacterium sp.]|nr:DinB family protein [Flavobacterium sp.]